MENSVVVSDYAAMDRLLREERKHVLGRRAGAPRPAARAGATAAPRAGSARRSRRRASRCSSSRSRSSATPTTTSASTSSRRWASSSSPTSRPARRSTAGRGGPDHASNRSSSAESKSIRLVSGRVVGSRRALDGALKRPCRNGPIRPHVSRVEDLNGRRRSSGATSRTSPTRSACCPSRAGPRGGDSSARRVERTPSDDRPSERGPRRADRDRGGSRARRDRRARAPRRSRTSTASRPRPWAPRTSSTRCPCPARRRRSSRSRASRAVQQKRAKFPTSKAPISAVFHSFRLIFGRAIISRNGLEAWMLFPERARAEHSC